LALEKIEKELGVAIFAYTLAAPFRLAAAAFAGLILQAGA
jgi:hypothetical protein